MNPCAVLLIAWLGAAVRAEAPPLARVRPHGALAAGATRIEQQGQRFTLCFEGEAPVRYSIDAADEGVRHGLLRIQELSSGCWPIWDGGACLRKRDGTLALPAELAGKCRLVEARAEGGLVRLRYEDALDGWRQRVHELWLEGRALCVRVRAADASERDAQPGYAGLWAGSTLAMPAARVLALPGTLATPIASFVQAERGWFCALLLDLPSSHAQGYRLIAPRDAVVAEQSLAFGYDTAGRYEAASDGKLPAALDDTLCVCVSPRLSDALVEPPRAARATRERIAGRMHLFLSQPAEWNAWAAQLARLSECGLDELAIYTFHWWSACAAEGNQNLGPDWFPARDPKGFAELCAAARARGDLFGPYVLYWLLIDRAPDHAARWMAKDARGQPKRYEGMELLAESAIEHFARRETRAIAQAYAPGLYFCDVQSYAAPVGSQNAGSLDLDSKSAWAKTLGDAIRARWGWLDALHAEGHAPVLGEGPFAQAEANLEWLWAGAVDGLQGSLDTGSGLAPGDQPASASDQPTRWLVAPEHELRVSARGFAQHGMGFYERFFGSADRGLVEAGAPFPLSEAALDRYRAYELSYGRAPFAVLTPVADGAGAQVRLADVVKEWGLVAELARRVQLGRIAAIRYGLPDGSEESFESRWFRAGPEAFVDPRLCIELEDGLAIRVNHARAPWKLEWQGQGYTLPEDGFLAHDGAGLLVFSAVADDSGGERIDYARVPGRLELFDGRGRVASYRGLSSAAKRFELHALARARRVHEDADGSLSVEQAPVAALARVELVPASAALAVGDELALTALLRRADGSFERHSVDCRWQLEGEACAEIDAGAILRALRPGKARVRLVLEPALAVGVECRALELEVRAAAR